MEWSLGFEWRALGDPVSEGRRVWEWIQRVRPLHPSLDLWRPTAGSREEAEQSPSITQDYLLQEIHQTQVDWGRERFGLTPAFCGQIGQGNKLSLSFNKPTLGSAGIILMIGEALGAALDASEDLADALMCATVSVFAPNTVGALTRKERPRSPTPPPFRYLPGWKMFFASDSPHYQRASQLATAVAPVGNGAIFTFGTLDTYPTVLDQW